MSPKWKNYFHPTDQTELQVDATFYVVPKQFYQLLNIFLQYKNHLIPAVHILMSIKRGTLYDKVVEKIILNKVIQTTEKDIERIDNHVLIRRRKRPVTIQKEKYIDALQKQIINGDITPQMYLKTISYQYKTQFKSFEELIEPVEVEDVNAENETEHIVQVVSTKENNNI